MIAEVPAVIKAYRKHNKGIPIEKLAHRYFDVLGEIQESKKKKDISALLGHCNMALCLLEPFIKYEKKESGQVPPVIPAIPEGPSTSTLSTALEASLRTSRTSLSSFQSWNITSSQSNKGS
jgi:hypothetical protein